MNRPSTARTGYRWVVLAMIFVTYCIAGADRANLGVVIPTIRSEYHLSNTDVGAMASLFYFGYAIVQIPSGYLFGKLGVRGLMVGSMVLTSLATLFMGLAGSVVQLKTARAVLGVAEGPINIGIVSTINRWFPPQEKGLATGVFISAIKFAPAFVPPLCALLLLRFGWREVFFIFAVPGLITSLLWFWLVRDEPKASRFVSQGEIDYIKSSPQAAAPAQPRAAAVGHFWVDRLIRTRQVPLLATSRAVFTSWNVWGCALGYFFLVGITYAIMTWVPTYLVSVKHFSTLKMGAVASAPWMGAIVGNLLGGWLSDTVFARRRKPVMMITSVATVGMMYALLFAPSDPVGLALLFFVAGVLLNLGYSTFLVYPMGIAARDKVPLAASIVNTGGSLGGAFAPFLVGLILDTSGWPAVFAFLAACSATTFLLLLSIVEPRSDAAGEAPLPAKKRTGGNNTQLTRRNA
ncbi:MULTISPECIES: MFS transporter [Pandoraea]|uniref:MFS transporter n=1 Tax=Pandoraea TaxID=93217 RepID=UPI001F5D2080|nr:MULTISPECIES: MFS transporter [Pandoraea]MCI3206391.1 MFS transporter [Pandoraea sp. LA3]MDN4584419.1 MFS transporter [Pandoraea capi]